MDVDKLDDDEFVHWMWDKYQLHLEKIKIQEKIQKLVTKIKNKTFVPGPNKELVGIINGHKKVSVIKDSASRQWAILNKKLKDIEKKERGGFTIKF